MARSIRRQIALIVVMSLPSVLMASAQQQTASDALEYKGIVAPAREAEIAPRLDGLLLKINFTAGQHVKQGDLLFEFGSSDKELSLTLAKAGLKQAEAQLRLAEVKFENAQTLSRRNVASRMQLLEAEAQRDLAVGKAEEARANVRAIRAVSLPSPNWTRSG